MFDLIAIQDSFGRASTQYDEQALLQREVRKAGCALARQYFPAGGTVLDLGCGTGAFAQETKKHWRSISLDVSHGMCVLAKHHGPVINADAELLPLAAESVDGIFSSLMLQWANRPEEVFCEIARVLKPGAHAVLTTFTDGTLLELKQAFAAVDSLPHVSEFPRAHGWLAPAADAGLSFVYGRQAPVVEFYPDAIALMRAIKDIGASNKQRTRRRGLTTPKQMAAVERAYEKRRTPKGLPATWQVLYLVLRKP